MGQFATHSVGGRPTLVVPSDEKTGQTPTVEIVETRLKLELNQTNVSLLIRTALLEEAANTSERLRALCAEILVDDNGDVVVVLDEDLWPECKEPILKNSVATELRSELDIACTAMRAPFAWPDIRKHSSNAAEHTSTLLDAYRKHGKIVRQD